MQRRLDDLELNRSAFGRRLGHSSGVVSDWFNKLEMPRGDSLVKFPRVLQCSGHWLLTGTGPWETPNGDSAEYRAGRREALEDFQAALATLHARSP